MNRFKMPGRPPSTPTLRVGGLVGSSYIRLGLALRVLPLLCTALLPYQRLGAGAVALRALHGDLRSPWVGPTLA